MEPFFLGLFDNIDNIKHEFSEHRWDDDVGADVDLTDANILLAYYNYQDYSGDAFVLFERYGKLYEVSGGHCSCYGLEGQWHPEETTIESLRHRLNEGNLGTWGWSSKENIFADELKIVLDNLEEAANATYH